MLIVIMSGQTHKSPKDLPVLCAGKSFGDL
jgi:hypothetical protein